MSLLITTVQNKRVQMVADTRVTSMSGGFQTLAEGKIVRSFLEDGETEVLVGTVGNADHHSLLRYSMVQRPLEGDTWDDVFKFFALFYREADDKGMQVFGPDTDFESVFHVALADKAWSVNGLSIEPILRMSASGSGADIAFGAMAAGSTAFQAAKIACDHNVYCAFPLDVWTAKDTDKTFSYERYDEKGERVTDIEPLRRSIQNIGESGPRTFT